MATAKQVALEIVGSLPDDCTLKDAAYRLYLRQLLEEAREDFREGRTFTQEEVEKKPMELLVIYGLIFGVLIIQQLK